MLIGSYVYLKIDSNLRGLCSYAHLSSSDKYEYGCKGVDSIDPPSIISIVGTNFVEDTEGINNGYPILAWQVESAEE